MDRRNASESWVGKLWQSLWKKEQPQCRHDNSGGEFPIIPLRELPTGLSSPFLTQEGFVRLSIPMQ